MKDVWQGLEQRLLISPKLLYFALGALYYVFYVYRMQFYEDYFGFSEDQSGVITAAYNVASFFGVTGWSKLADTLRRHRLMLMVLGVAMAGVFELLLLRACLPQSAWFWLTLIVMTVYGGIVGGVMPLTDYQILRLLKERFGKDPTLYGRQVLFGTLAYGLITFCTGRLIRSYGVGILFYLLPIPAIFFVLIIQIFGYPDSKNDPESKLITTSKEDLSLHASLYEKIEPSVYSGKTDTESKIELGRTGSDVLVEENPSLIDEQSNRSISTLSEGVDTSPSQSIPEPSQTGSSSSVVRAAILAPRFVFFLLMILSIGIGRQTLTLFLPHYMRHSLDLTPTEVGIASSGSSLFSLLFLFSGPYILPRLGVQMMLAIGLGALTARLISYTLLQPGPACVYHVCLVELLNGLSFSFTHLAGVREAAICAPPGWEATFQAIYNSAYVQFPAVFVSLIGGLLYKSYGGLLLFVWTARISLGSLLLLLLKLLRDHLGHSPTVHPSPHTHSVTPSQ